MIKIEYFSANFANISKEEAFEKTVELAFKNLLGEAKDIDQMSDDEIRAAVNDYYTRFDLRLNSQTPAPFTAISLQRSKA